MAREESRGERVSILFTWWRTCHPFFCDWCLLPFVLLFFKPTLSIFLPPNSWRTLSRLAANAVNLAFKYFPRMISPASAAFLFLGSSLCRLRSSLSTAAWLMLWERGCHRLGCMLKLLWCLFYSPVLPCPASPVPPAVRVAGWQESHVLIK